jgi:SAM-dependent methyltransferase
MELARRTLGHLARGLEIGASAFAPFPGVRAWNLDHPGARLFQEAQRRHAGRAVPVHVHGTAAQLPLRDGSLDFVLASHVIEHMPDAIGALGEWERVLRSGGILFLIVPHRDRTFDAGRPCTDLAHLLADHALGTTAASDSMVPTSHYHVWRTQGFLELIEYLRRSGHLGAEVVAVEDVDSRAGNGFTVVLEKRARRAPPPADPRAPVAFHHLVPDLPFQVVGRSLEVIVPGPELPATPALARGRWRVAAIRDGFPPRVARRFTLEHGPALPPPELARARWDGERLLVSGAHLAAGTWLEATYPDGSVHRALPEVAGDELFLDLAGLVLPRAGFDVVAVSPPPGGGRGAPLRVSVP